MTGAFAHADPLGELANAHWLAGYRTLIASIDGEWRDFGAVHAFVGGVALPFANGALVLGPAAERDLRAAIEWVAAANLPFGIRLDHHRAQDLLDVPAGMGLVRDPETMPGMVLMPVPLEPVPAPGVTTLLVDADLYAEFAQLLADTGIPSVAVERAFPPELVQQPDASLFIARLDGKPAATSIALRTGDTCGVYAVGTVEEARRRGVGTAVTWAAVSAAREWGSRAVVLQATEMGYPVYRAMGFRHVVDYVRFGPPVASREVEEQAVGGAVPESQQDLAT